MPNWVRTRIEFKDISDEKFEQIVERFKTIAENGYEIVPDFEKVIPMPDYIFRGNLGAEEKARYGKNNWYDWSIENWGTKWNACNGYVFECCHGMEFDTAWAFAEPVVRRLAVLTESDIEVEFADEDFGYNCDKAYVYKNGDISYCDIESCSDDAWEIVEDLWGISKEELYADL